jgi:uncharacterized repeat protein (TIGR03847 family)
MSLPSPYDVINTDHFTAGAVGPPGQRVFYLQARGDGMLVSLRCEKQQVGALGEYLERIIADLPERPIGSLPATLDLIEPVLPAWVVGGLGLGYDADHDRLILLIEELVVAEADDDDDDDDVEEPEEDDVSGADDDDDSSAGATARWVVTREQVMAFVAHAQDLMAGGRPTCPLCGRPMDADGHTCIKTNGHRPH